MKFYKHLAKEAREARKLTQQDVANALGVTKQSVSNWENDNKPHQPSKKNIIELAKFLGVEVTNLADTHPIQGFHGYTKIPPEIEPIFNDSLSIEMLKSWATMTRKERLQVMVSIEEIITNRPPPEYDNK